MQAEGLIALLAGGVVVGFGLFLIGLSGLIVVKPRLAERFFKSFASSGRAHFTEMGLRLLVGVALVNSAHSMRHPAIFTVFGWILIATAVALLLIPWRWHNKFAAWAVPMATRRMWLLAIGAAALGAFLLYGASRAIFA